jgi:hypothetical protein
MEEKCENYRYWHRPSRLAISISDAFEEIAGMRGMRLTPPRKSD